MLDLDVDDVYFGAIHWLTMGMMLFAAVGAVIALWSLTPWFPW